VGNFNKEIFAPSLKDNETWNDCPNCGAFWKDKFPTPGLIHRTRLCYKCIEIIIDDSELYSTAFPEVNNG